MITLQWRLPAPLLTIRWRGPEGALAPIAITNPNHPIPTLIGPPGLTGPEGPPASVIDGGEFT